MCTHEAEYCWLWLSAVTASHGDNSAESQEQGPPLRLPAGHHEHLQMQAS